MERTFDVISPIDGSLYVSRAYASDSQIIETLAKARSAKKKWKSSSLDERAHICTQAINYLVKNADEIGREITHQMGRPIKYTPSEISGGVKERAEFMISKAKEVLADITIDDQRFIRREPLGTVLVLAPWNYPFLTSVNAIIPALMAGNTVILKHSDQTPLTSERYAEAFEYAGLPEGVFQFLHMDHDQVAEVIKDERIDYVAFTGSVGGGKAIQKAIGSRFISAGLELGGKDPAYIRADADVDHAVENCVDGAFFNSGQSCCGLERIYVHQEVADEFTQKFVALTKKYILGNPLDNETQLGPIARKAAVAFIQNQINEAVHLGAKKNIDLKEKNREAYLFPEVLTDVTHEMSIMTEETFGPVVGIMAVKNDEQAINLMNDSNYGLTASIWTRDEDMAMAIGDKLETGTVFMNRCDYLDPALAWTGVKNSGKGCTLSEVGYEMLTRPKSFHLRKL